MNVVALVAPAWVTVLADVEPSVISVAAPVAALFTSTGAMPLGDGEGNRGR